MTVAAERFNAVPSFPNLKALPPHEQQAVVAKVVKTLRDSGASSASIDSLQSIVSAFQCAVVAAEIPTGDPQPGDFYRKMISPE